MPVLSNRALIITYIKNNVCDDVYKNYLKQIPKSDWISDIKNKNHKINPKS